MIAKRTKKLASGAAAESGGILSEMQTSLDCVVGVDAEEKTLMKAYQLSGQAKVGGVIDYAETLLQTNAKFLLFAHH